MKKTPQMKTVPMATKSEAAAKPLAMDKLHLWLQRHSAFLATEDEMI